MDKKKTLLSNFFALLSLRASNFIFPMIYISYLVKVLGVELYGLVVFAEALLSYFGLLIDYGFGLSATRLIALNRDNREKITEIFSSVLTIKSIILTISVIVLYLIINSFEKLSDNEMLFYYSLLAVIGSNMFPIWYFHGLEKMKFASIVNFVAKGVFTLLMFFVIKAPSDFIFVPIISGVGFIIAGILSLIIIRVHFNQKFKLYSLSVLKKYFYDSTQYFISRISVSLYSTINVLLLGATSSLLSVGYYSIAEKIFNALQSIYQPIVQALYPYITKNKDVVFLKKSLLYAFVFNLILITIIYFTGDIIVDLLFSDKASRQTIEVLNILILSLIAIVPSMFLGYPFLGALGYAKYVNYASLFSAVAHLLGILFLWSNDYINIYTVSLLVVFSNICDLAYRIYGIRIEKLWNN